MWIASIPFWTLSAFFAFPGLVLPLVMVDEHKRGDKKEFAGSVRGFFCCWMLCGVFAIVATWVGRL